MDVRHFFASVKKGHHLANLRVQGFLDDEKAESEAATKIIRVAKIAEQNEANRMAARKRRNDAKNAEVAKDIRTDEEKIQDEIDELAEDIPGFKNA